MSKKLLQAAAGAAAGEALYVEDVFSTYLYEGNGSTQTITNGIDLDGEGGVVWIKSRTSAEPPEWMDTEQGAGYRMLTSGTNPSQADADGLTSFNSDGFSLGADTGVNGSGLDLVSWTFRKAEKFFDVVTYTGDGVAGRTVAHNLGSTPAVIIVKRLTGLNDWFVYHTSLGATKFLKLNTTADANTNSVIWNDTSPTDSVFSVGTDSGVNTNTVPYVAYLFASDAGGFGDDGSESIIKCGSFTSDGSGSTQIDLEWEPQWIIFKKTTAASQWYMFDTMRGLTVYDQGNDQYLWANDSVAEASANCGGPNSTGFEAKEAYFDSGTWVYIAIRRPMKTPESGTEVFAVAPRSNTASADYAFVSNFPVDMGMARNVIGSTEMNLGSRMTGDYYLQTPNTNAEATTISWGGWDSMNSASLGFSKSAESPVEKYAWMFKRATGFFDVVAYTGDGVNGRDVIHNLKVLPEFVIIKERNSSTYWLCWHKDINDYYLRLNDTNAAAAPSTFWDHSTYPVTSTSFPIGTHGFINGSGDSYIAYLFATLAGVSKVGSYTGTGSNVDVDCGFSAGARFILIKRTDSTGDWYVWDSERGIVAGNDPYLLLNSTAAEVTSTDYIDPLSSGFTVTSSAPAALNASGGTYIYLSIA